MVLPRLSRRKTSGLATNQEIKRVYPLAPGRIVAPAVLFEHDVVIANERVRIALFAGIGPRAQMQGSGLINGINIAIKIYILKPPDPNSSSSAFASLRSKVSWPSVNHS